MKIWLWHRIRAKERETKLPAIRLRFISSPLPVSSYINCTRVSRGNVMGHILPVSLPTYSTQMLGLQLTRPMLLSGLIGCHTTTDEVSLPIRCPQDPERGVITKQAPKSLSCRQSRPRYLNAESDSCAAC